MKERVLNLKWSVIKRYARRAGLEVRAMAEATYLTFRDPEVSYRHKSILIAALVYFLSPIDAIPDFLPGGFADDLAVMLSAVMATGRIGKKHLQFCRQKYQVELMSASEKKESKHAPTPPPTS